MSTLVSGNQSVKATLLKLHCTFNLTYYVDKECGVILIFHSWEDLKHIDKLQLSDPITFFTLYDNLLMRIN